MKRDKSQAPLFGPTQGQLSDAKGTSAPDWQQPPTLEDLRPAQTLVPAFNAIRSFVAANSPGLTRDEAILEELTKVLHAKVLDERHAELGGQLSIYALAGESDAVVAEKVRNVYDAARSQEGQRNDVLVLDDAACAFAVRALHAARILGAGRDVIGEAYETLVFPALRGGQGQFFTPKNVARCMAEILEVQPGHRVIDPACGTGGFLTEVADITADNFGRAACVELFGVDKDHLLARLAQDNLGFRHAGGKVVCANSLLPSADQHPAAAEVLADGVYDRVITNPPFGAKIPVSGPVLDQFDLARQWRHSKSGWVMSLARRESTPPQILFVEKCLNLLKEGGRCAIVLPEGVAGNQSSGYVRQWLTERAEILGVIDCPLETFMPSTSTKTVVIVFERRSKPERRPVFMAVAQKCGHDRRGKPLVDDQGASEDDFPLVSAAFQGRDELAKESA